MQAKEGELAGISFRVCGAGPPLVLLPLDLSVKLLHRGIDALTSICGEVCPGQAGVIREHHHRGLGQIGQHRPHPAGAEPMVAGHDLQPRAERRQASRVQHRRAYQAQRRDALRMLGDEPLQIGETAAGKMRPGNGEMVEECGEAGLDGRSLGGSGGRCYGCFPFLRGPGAIMLRAPFTRRRR